MFEAEISRIQKAVESRFDEVDASVAAVQEQLKRVDGGLQKTRRSIRRLRETMAGSLIELGIALTAQMSDIEARFQTEIEKVNKRIDDLGKAS